MTETSAPRSSSPLWLAVIAAGLVAAGSAGIAGYALGRMSVVTAPAAAPQAQQDPNALPPGVTQEVFSDWTLVCNDGSQGNTKTCFAVQQASSERGVVLLVMAGYDQNGGRTLLVRAPLGVQLQRGIEFKLGEDQPAAFAFASCTQQTCDAVLNVKDDGYAKLEAAGKFELSYHLQSGERVVVNVSMKGLTDAYAKIVRPEVKPAPAAAPAEAPAAAPAETPAAPPAAGANR